MSTEVQTIQQEVKTFAGTIPTVIKTNQELAVAEGLFTQIRKKRKEVEKFFKEKFIDPAKALLDGHKAEAALAIQPLNDAETVLDGAIRKFRKVEADRIAKEQEKLNAKHDKKADKLLAQGKDLDGLPPPPVLAAPASSTKTETGTLIYRKVKKLIEVDAALTPDDYCIITKTPNKRKIDAELRAGGQVAGWRLDEIEELASR